MLSVELLSEILNSINFPIVFVDTEHIIQYMNSLAIKKHKKHGYLIGKSIFFFYNEKSNEKIIDLYNRLKNGEKEILFFSSKKKRILFKGIYDKSNQLLGYFERFDYLE